MVSVEDVKLAMEGEGEHVGTGEGEDVLVCFFDLVLSC